MRQILFFDYAIRWYNYDIEDSIYEVFEENGCEVTQVSFSCSEAYEDDPEYEDVDVNEVEVIFEGPLLDEEGFIAQLKDAISGDDCELISYDFIH